MGNYLNKDTLSYIIPCLMRKSGIKNQDYSLLIDKIDYFEPDITEHTLEFKRRCMIINAEEAVDDETDPGMHIVFDRPLTLMGRGWMDTCFKLKIRDNLITGDAFIFNHSSNSNYGDWKFRINKYCDGS